MGGTGGVVSPAAIGTHSEWPLGEHTAVTTMIANVTTWEKAMR
jgi:hypothetical protein